MTMPMNDCATKISREVDFRGRRNADRTRIGACTFGMKCVFPNRLAKAIRQRSASRTFGGMPNRLRTTQPLSGMHSCG